MLGLCFLLCGGVSAQFQFDDQKFNYSGKDFWLGLYYGGQDFSVFHITGAKDANISFEFTALNIRRNFFLPAGTTIRIQLRIQEIRGIVSQIAGAVSNKSLHITSDENIVVNYISSLGHDDDAILLYPSDNQNYGLDYYLNGPPLISAVSGFGGGGFTLVSRCDSTVLEITPSQNMPGHPAGISFPLVLNRGESYVLVCDTNTSSLAGTKVHVNYASCCNPINIFETYELINAIWPIPPFPSLAPVCCADQQLEQLLPANVWDTIYPLVQFKNAPYSIITIVSSANNNVISFDGIPRLTLNEGQKYDTIIKGAVMLTSRSPISIMQLMISQSESWRDNQIPVPPDSATDPASLWILPLRDGVKETYVSPLVIGDQIHPLNVLTLISKSSNIHTVEVNNQNVATQFVPFNSNPDYMYAYIKLDSGQFHVASQDKIIAYHYSAYPQGSIAYPLGDVNALQDITFVLEPTDTTVVCGTWPVTFSPPPADNYLWWDGSFSDSIKTSDTGLFYVRLYYDDSCKSNIKLFYVKRIGYDPSRLNDTLYTCLKDPITLTATDTATSYLWSDGSTGQQMEVYAYGDAYSVVETYQPLCRQTTHYFTVLPQDPEKIRLDLGPDTYICQNRSLPLKGAGKRTVWSTGETGDTIIITKAGVYWAQIADSCFGLEVTDSIVVRDSLCPDQFCTLVFPTAFSPNGDGRNDLFRPVSYGDFSGYHLVIYNRWGQKVYETDRMEKGWPGTLNDEPADIGVYFYRCSYECPADGNKNTKGEVTVIR